MKIRCVLVIQLGIFTFLRHKYYINGKLWEDPKNFKSCVYGYAKHHTLLGSGTSMNVKYYDPMVIEP